MTRNISVCVPLAVFLMLSAVQSPAGEPVTPSKEQSEKKEDEPSAAATIPIKIDADKIERLADELIFTGNVIATRGDTVVYCDKLTTKMEDVEVVDPETKEKTTRREPVSITATGNVNVVQESTDRRATAETAEYDTRAEKITLTGGKDKRARLWDGRMTTIADIIIYYPNEDRIIWRGDRRPQFSVNPEDRPEPLPSDKSKKETKDKVAKNGKE